MVGRGKDSRQPLLCVAGFGGQERGHAHRPHTFPPHHTTPPPPPVPPSAATAWASLVHLGEDGFLKLTGGEKRAHTFSFSFQIFPCLGTFLRCYHGALARVLSVVQRVIWNM